MSSSQPNDVYRWLKIADCIKQFSLMWIPSTYRIWAPPPSIITRFARNFSSFVVSGRYHEEGKVEIGQMHVSPATNLPSLRWLGIVSLNKYSHCLSGLHSLYYSSHMLTTCRIVRIEIGWNIARYCCYVFLTKSFSYVFIKWV